MMSCSWSAALCGRRLLEIVLPQAHVELGPRQAETFGRLRLVPAAVAHDLRDRVALDRVQVRCRRRTERPRRGMQGQVSRGDQTALAQNRRAFERVPQLT